MDSCVDADFEDALLPSIVEQGTYADAFYGVGTFDSGLGLFTRRSILEDNGIRIPEAGTTPGAPMSSPRSRRPCVTPGTTSRWT
ncbi:MAG TPA: hypothetical protein VK875_06985 [Euzebyales bacterium]|nr:hypothetical protein [Euzebyales bacterium]